MNKKVPKISEKYINHFVQWSQIIRISLFVSKKHLFKTNNRFCLTDYSSAVICSDFYRSVHGQTFQEKTACRKPNRLKDYDYSQNGAYFVTICTKDRHEMLGKVINGQLALNEYGLIVKREIENISTIRKECTVEKFIVMPNHIHLIVQIVAVGDDGNRPAGHRADFHQPLRRKTVSNMIQGLKGAITRQIGSSIWQRSYHDHIIRNEAEYQQIWDYIDKNPLGSGTGIITRLHQNRRGRRLASRLTTQENTPHGRKNEKFP